MTEGESQSSRTVNGLYELDNRAILIEDQHRQHPQWTSATLARLLGRGGTRSVAAGSRLVKPELLVLDRSHSHRDRPIAAPGPPNRPVEHSQNAFCRSLVRFCPAQRLISNIEEIGGSATRKLAGPGPGMGT